MSTPNSSNISLRSDVDRPLFHCEMDLNFTEVKNVIDQSNQNKSDIAKHYVTTRSLLTRSYAEAGFNLVDGSFEAGGTVTSATDVLLYEATGIAYLWLGALPKVVPAGSTPASTGGIDLGAWVDAAHSNVEERLLGVGAKIYRGSNGVYVQNGDVVPAETTHLRVLINGKVENVAMSPVASGVVSLLTETSATIGGSNVYFTPWIGNEIKEYTDIVYKASGGNSAVENMVLGIPISATLNQVVKCENGTIFQKVAETGNPSDFAAISEIHAADFGATGVSDDLSKLQDTFDQSKKSDTASADKSRISLTPKRPSFSGDDVANFEDITWPDNVQIKFKGPTREEVLYLNQISEPYGSYVRGVPVNEYVVASPYHTGIIIDTKSPASYKGKKQTAHEISDEIGSTSYDYGSLIFNYDGKLQFGITSDPKKNRLMLRSRRDDDSLSSPFFVIDRDTGYLALSRRNQGKYPLEVGGEIVATSGTNSVGSAADILTPRLIARLDSGHGVGLSYHPDNDYGVISTLQDVSEGKAILNIPNIAFYYRGNGGYGNSNASCMRVSKNSATDRSINAAGTVNASGADYAEYMCKNVNCGDISKGDVCGIDSDGKITDKFDEAVSFCIKSTNPSFVGGDRWGEDMSESDNESERVKVDRIAFCGQVPVNCKADVGDYIVPINDGGSISAIGVSSPSFEDYKLSIGRVIKIEEGRPIVIVKVA